MTLADAIETIIARVMRRVDYHAMYPSRVVTQHADGSLDLVPDSSRVPSCQRVPVRTLRGLSVEVSEGARVLLGYEGGDPALPVVLLWEPGDADVVRVNGGDSRVARDGEPVVSSGPFATWLATVGTATGAGAPPSTIGAISGGAEELKVP